MGSPRFIVFLGRILNQRLPIQVQVGIELQDNFRDVYNKDGSRTFCLEFELSCKESGVNPTFITNFDKSFEDGIPDIPEGREKYVRHKTRERNPEIVKEKKEFKKKYGNFFCEVCLFDFSETYGSRGEGFIECHHNVPLHEEEKERITAEEINFIVKTIREKLIQKTNGAHDEMILSKLFKIFDVNKNGLLTVDKLYAMLLQMEIPVHKKYLVRIIKKFDTSGNNSIEFGQFLNHVLYNPYK